MGRGLPAGRTDCDMKLVGEGPQRNLGPGKPIVEGDGDETGNRNTGVLFLTTYDHRIHLIAAPDDCE